jgi:hypothetical protein
MTKVNIETGDLVNMIIGGSIYEINSRNRNELASAINAIREGATEKIITLETIMASAVSGKKEGKIKFIEDEKGAKCNDNGFIKDCRKILVRQVIKAKKHDYEFENTLDIIYFSKN